MIDAGGVSEVEREMARYYDAEEDREQRSLDPRRVALRDRFIERARALPVGRPAVEIGTGPGRDAVALADAGVELIGVDLSAGHAARASAHGVRMTVASARSLPFARDSIGALWSMSTLMHIPDAAIDGAMREIARVLAPGATVCIGVWGGGDLEHFAEAPGVVDGPRRFFSRRSETRWHRLLEILGRIDEFDIWKYEGDDDAFHYHVAFVTAG